MYKYFLNRTYPATSIKYKLTLMESKYKHWNVSYRKQTESKKKSKL